MSRKYTKDNIIHEFKKVHNSTYDYSKVEYLHLRIKVKIFCKKCKYYFEQTPRHHKLGHGCPKCAIAKTRLSFIEFKKKAEKKHNGKYAYINNNNYKGTLTKVKIKCPKHGVFYQRANSHTTGQGCPKCFSQNKFSNYINFEKKALLKHGRVYAYHQDYKDSRTKVKITCPKHGDFYQRASSHLSGHGCPYCSNIFSKSELEILNLTSKIFRLKFLKIRPDWLEGLEIDMFNKHCQLGIEYQGEQHFLRYADERYKPFKKEKIQANQKRDRKKKRLCKKLGIKLIIIPCYEWKKLKTEKEKREYLKEKNE